MATITFDQATLSPPGVTDRSRTDGLINGSQVTVTVSEVGTVSFVDVPEGDVGSVSSLVQTAPTIWKFTPTAGVYGSWLVEFQPAAEGAAAVRRIFAVRSPNQGLRIPAFNERAGSNATIGNGAQYVDASDDNEGGSYRGWARAFAELFRAVAEGFFTANKVRESGGPTTLSIAAVPASGALRRNSTGQVVGGPVLVDDAGNITGAGTLNGRTIANWVDGPASATSGYVATFSGTTGKLLANAGWNPANWVAGPASSTTNNIPSFSTTSGKGIQDSGLNTSAAAPAAIVAGGTAVSGVSGSLARADHVHALAAFGSTSGTFCQGDDARLRDDRTAGGLRSATTVVAVSSAAAPSAGTVLTATSSTAAAWQALPTTAEALGTTGADVTVGTAAPPSAGAVLTATSGIAATWQVPSTTAEALGTTGADVVVGTAGPPSAGAVLTATSSTAAAWQTIPAASASVSGLMSSSDFTKLDNLAPGKSAAVGALTVDAYYSTPSAPAYAASVSLDTSIKNDFEVGTLTGNITITLTNPANGRQGFVAVKQDTTGGRTVTLTAAGYINQRDTGTSDLVAAATPNAITVYGYLMYALGGTNYLLLSKVQPV